MSTDIINVEEVDEAKASVHKIMLWQRKWGEFSLKLEAFNWREYPFKPESLSEIPREIGVYTFVIKPGIANHPSCSYLIYVGKTENQDLRQRFSQYLKEQSGSIKARPKVQYMLTKYLGYVYFVCLPLDGTISPGTVEDELLKAYLPLCNSRYPAEVSRIIGAF